MIELLENPDYRNFILVDDNLEESNVMIAAACLGSLVAGIFADKLGRKTTYCIASMIFLAGSVLQAGLDTAAQLYGSRVIVGFSVGIIAMVIPLCKLIVDRQKVNNQEIDQSELAPKHLRGRLVSLFQLGLTFGVCWAYWMGFSVFGKKDQISYRIPLGLQLIPALLALISLIYIPPSPRYSIEKHLDDQALDTLSNTRSHDSQNNVGTLMEFIEIKQTVNFEQHYRQLRSYRQLFAIKPVNNFKRLLLGIAAQVFQELIGIPAIMLYTPDINRTIGITDTYHLVLSTSISGLVNFVATIPGVVFVDKIKRRTLMIVGALGCSVCMFIMAGIASHYQYKTSSLGPNELVLLSNNGSFSRLSDEDKPLAIIFVITLYAYIACYTCSWGVVGWIYPTELYSQGHRAKALGITTTAGLLFKIIVIRLTSIFFMRITWATYLFYAVICILIAIIVYISFPETKGKSLEEIDLIFMCNFRYYDPNAHYPKTAAETLEQLERLQQEHVFNIQFDGEVEDVLFDEA